MKSNATKSFKAGKITREERDLAHNRSKLLQEELKDYMEHYRSKIKQLKVQGDREEGEPIFLMTQKKCCKS